MENLFIMRHGEYSEKDGEYRLNERGEAGIYHRGGIIRDILKNNNSGNSAKIITSTAPRALDSSIILAKRTGITEIIHDERLWTASDSPVSDNYCDSYNYEKLLKRIQDEVTKSDIILMTHLELMQMLPNQILDEQKIDDHISCSDMEDVPAIYFNLKQKEYLFLP